MPKDVVALPGTQQEAIRQVLVKTGLLTEAGEPTNYTRDDIPEQYAAGLKASLQAIGVDQNLELFGFGLGCAVARVAEAAAVAACVSVPGGQIAVAACIAAAHEAANAACN